MPFRAPLAEGAVLARPWAGAGEPWACAWVVAAGEFCDENLELMLLIQELRRELALDSGGVAPFALLSLLLPRPSSAGRLGGAFIGGVVVVAVEVVVVGKGRGGEAGCWTDGGGSGCCCSCCCGFAGGLPCDDILGGASLARPGEAGACWRW